ncbi:MAG TPA: FlgD immunoglobulin-like domain containing protein, partial [Candidatus Krumholzibacteria bacterium]
ALSPVATFDLYLVKFSETGAWQWNKRFGLTGEAWGDLDFGGGPRPEITGPDIFLAVLNTNGSHVWSKIFGAGDREAGTSVSFASNGDVVLSAWTQGTDPFSFGGAMFSGQASHQDLLVARFFQANGNHRWSTEYSGPGGDTRGYAGETDGQLFIGGTMTSTTDFGGGPLPNAGLEQVFIARFADQLTGAGPMAAPRAELFQNSPNPFNPSTTIAYALSSPARVTIEIADASGAVVARLDEGVRPAGSHSASWNGRDARGRAVASGVYFYRLAGRDDVPARKMVLLK